MSFRCECGLRLNYEPRLPFRCTCGRVQGGPRPSRPSVQRRLRDAWIARLVGRYREPGDAGLGDSIERLLAAYGSERVLAMLAKVGLKNCGCKDRRDWLNRRYPYGPG